MNLLLRRFRSLPPDGLDPAEHLILRRGSLADYDALARHHYRAARPATAALVLVLEDPAGDTGPEPVAVLVVSMPTLNGRWRNAAWPGRFDHADKRLAAARLNAELRTISRIVIDPRWRGQGLARRLVRSYLDAPLTPCTEALASMGACCPLFTAAGMTEHPLPPPRRDTRLRRALARARLRPLDLLTTPYRAVPIEPDLRRWANDAGHTRAHRNEPLPTLTRRAALALLSRPTVYTHTHNPTGQIHRRQLPRTHAFRSPFSPGPEGQRPLPGVSAANPWSAPSELPRP